MKPDTLIYTALGDSIAFGTGAVRNRGYTARLSEYLARNRSASINPNWNQAADGLNSSQLLARLQSDSGLRGQIQASGLITVSIGGNDFLGPFMQALGNMLLYQYKGQSGNSISGLLEDFLRWQRNPGDLSVPANSRFNALFAELLHSAFPLALNRFAANWKEILTVIREDLTAEADLIVNTLYNPVVHIPKLNELTDPFIRRLNGEILNGQLILKYRYQTADVYERFLGHPDPDELVIGDMNSLMRYLSSQAAAGIPLHPTDKGYEVIFDLIREKLPRLN